MGFEKSILESLNDAQKAAVCHVQGAMLILAGAGSGKTKTLTSRLAYLIGVCGVPSENTLTLTFTNKASKEMQERALKLLKNQILIPPLLCTFHRFGLLFLRQHMSLLKRACDFSLLDSDDAKTLCKQLKITHYRESISKIKNRMISLDTQDRECYKAYERYQNALERDNLVDFDDLLVLSLKILQDNLKLAKETSERYHYIMVDEYQDTNALQFEFLKTLSFTHNNLCVVGDDDQSIYGFRGADISNILNFSKHYEGAKVVKLETNYRSSAEILECANSLISHNQNRHNKTLKSFKGPHKSVVCKEYLTQKEESLNVAYQIKALLNKGEDLEDIAILYRLNGLSRSVEESLNALNIPYRLIGAVSFYERAEIKDALATMHLVAKESERFFVKRILNKPTRGIGKITQELIFSVLDHEELGLEEALKKGVFKGKLSVKNEQVLKDFIAMIERLRDAFNVSVEKFCECFLEETNLLRSYEKEDNYEERKGFVEELLGLVKEHFKTNPTHSLLDFLNESTLDVYSTDTSHKVSCMSVHMSKGLEFKHVFVIGLEEGFFPHRGFNDYNDEDNLEEERRLAYVAITRAKEELQLSYVKERLYFGRKTPCVPSLFLKEAKLLHKDDKKVSPIRVGDLVSHKIFGTGRVLAIEDSTKCMKVNFGGRIQRVMQGFLEKVREGF
ncbi:DNA helicase UvrD [Helicobacter cetorum]|uniref:DNA 3'-5' helicase n=1 Tax=Helicobacter cetorum (strain ATCC BAA-540 / CCUG 52418 / MIT 99-5656) TaxID=1163745 RepID=I0ESG1_HELCM|nr:ATP-dependent helicase [Helicobacter cetorum]AFI05880.1 DNA helicase II [Helicobacter cetorum MIT 99-5656]